ncbi:RagB/SusD family nutrient uptake outer membrane protein [uncultured Bacteroides sp.]|uniref:RagB/SusD family nutrient uptake outer membrane protein n=1 Tax=uncultured Bacteroides sp. TaxID=162156 RepID=UPI0023CF77F1|nr:RagB/SusD family nutrient uptake outer membrane protein [uncultured Bacteroides sp.]MDE5760603.1 RagB/SusD family nutrient uptake outer membrane protein [Bacteroides sp.]
MKNIFKYGLLGLGVVTLSSCINTLDTHPTTVFDAETVWGSKATVEGFVYATYTDVIHAGYAGSGTSVGWEARTPNSVRCSQVGEGIDGVATELGVSESSDFGCNRFSLLRRANLIIHNVENSATLSDAEKKELSAHGYLMRGMIFFDQARKMGRFVPVREVFDVEHPEAVNIPMTQNVAEGYDIIISDLEKAADYLPTDNMPGLPTRYAAGVLLSRAALQAYAYTQDSKYLDVAIRYASDVVTNSGVSLATNLSPAKSLWNETDSYNEEILWAYYREKDNTNVQSFEELMRTYPNISTDNVLNSQSPIALRQANGQTFEGWAIYFPTQDLADQFLVTDEATGEALPWYETSQYVNSVDILNPATVTEVGQVDQYQQNSGDWRRIPTPQDFAQTRDGYPVVKRFHQLKAGSERDLSDLMYSGRDNRFYTTMVYDKATWMSEKVELNLGGNLSMGVRDKEDGGWYNTTTGYYWRKSNIENPEPRAYYASKVALHFNIARLGEAYLNLAEAQLLKKNIPAAVEALNATRTKHGGLAPSQATTEAEAWADYIRERNCEMTNETGDIYFSYLRWGKYGGYANNGKAAGEVIDELDRPAYKIEISRDRTKLVVNQVTLLNSANRHFTTRRYLLPIAQSFLNTREAYGLDHTQNEGW